MIASNIHMHQENASPQTQCPHCNTVFEVPQELLESSDTRVKCGECLNIFDSRDSLRVASHAVQMTETLATLSAGATNFQDDPPVRKPEFSDLDVTYSDFDLFSEDADTPYLDYFEETTEPVALDFDSVAPDSDQTLNDDVFRHDVTISSDLPIITDPPGIDPPPSENVSPAGDTKGSSPPKAEPGAEQPATASPGTKPSLGLQPSVEFQSAGTSSRAIEFDYAGRDRKIRLRQNYSTASQKPASTDLKEPDTTQDPMVGAEAPGSDPFLYEVKRQKTDKSRWKMVVLLGLVLPLLLGGLYAYRERTALANSPTLRPVIVAFCSVLGCHVPLMSDLSQLRVLRRYMFSHPKIQDALVINVVFRNAASFEQRYPNLIIKMSDITGTNVATRNFKPQEYLPAESWVEKQTLAAETSVDVSLEIRDPGKNATSFTLDFQ